MNKTLKRFLLILIGLIITLLLIPKSEKAFTLVHETFGNGKYWCVQMNQDYTYGSEYTLYKTYHLYGDYYTINNEQTKYTNDIDTLNAIAYITMQGPATRQPENRDPIYSPYYYGEQVALWYYLYNSGGFTDGKNEKIFDGASCYGIRYEDGQLKVNYTQQNTGVPDVFPKQGNGYPIYRNALSNTKKYTGVIEVYKCKNNQTIIYINVSEKPDEPEKPQEPEKPVATEFYGSINGMAWVDGQIGDKAVLKSNGQYDLGEDKVYDVAVKVTARVQTIKQVEAQKYIYKIETRNFTTESGTGSASEIPSGAMNYQIGVDDDGNPIYHWEKRIELAPSYTPEVTSYTGFPRLRDNQSFVYHYAQKYIAYYTDEGMGTRKIEITTSTDENGKYSVAIPLTKYTVTEGPNKGDYCEYIKDYTVAFSYNGVEYITCVTNPSPSGNLASEDGLERTNFNKKFQTIKEITDKNLDDAYYTWNEANMKSEIAIGRHYPYNSRTAVDGSAKKPYYEMNANTRDRETGFGIRNTTQVINNVNIGLNHRYTDLALTMNVDKTKITINGKTTEYDYPDISINRNEELQNWLNSVLNDNKINVDVFKSDYYYRINDYINKPTDSNFVLDENETKDLGNLSEDQELDIQVTYKVRLFGQVRNCDTAVKELIYYYDNTKYEFVGITSGSYADVQPDPDGNIAGYGSIPGYGQIKVEGNWNTTNADQELYFTFKVRKENGAIVAADNTINGNIVAITSYYTADGLLDIDSSTRSIVGNGGEIQYEDDTARAEDVKVNLLSESRTISGKVFDNADTNTNKTVNDVIVQLIEIRNNSEYIWQETTVGTGGNRTRSVVRMQDEEYSAYDYENGAGTGEYKFINMVPGNYIVRFIYGDGYNRDITVDNTKYNGADYKSMADLEYRNEWLNDSLNSKGNSEKYPSLARDNEARRLSIMATMTEIDAGLGTALDVYANNKTDLTVVEKANILNYLNKLKDNNDNEFNAAINYLKTAKGNNDSWTTWRNNVLNNISDGDLLVVVKKLIAYKTFMVAETSKINVPVQTERLDINQDGTTVNPTKNDAYKIVNYNHIAINFTNVNLGLMLRPQVKLELEKHITALKVTPNGTGVNAIVDAGANIADIINSDVVSAAGSTSGLTTIKSTRENRGFWRVETETDELNQGATVEAVYTYVVKNNGDEDYISEALVNAYTSDQSGYSASLENQAAGVKSRLKGITYKYGDVLGTYYYTGTKANTDVAVTSRVELLGEAINNQIRYDEAIAGDYFKKINEEAVTKTIYDTDGTSKEEKLDTVVETNAPTNFLTTGISNGGKWTLNKDVDANKTIKLSKVSASLNNDEEGNIPSYIAEILRYSSASGARNLITTPGNLNYVHSKDKEMTLDNSYIYEVDGKTYERQDANTIPEGATKIRKANERDEFWGETIIITKPTGGNRILAMQIGIIVAVSVAVIGVGIVLIKKFILKK